MSSINSSACAIVVSLSKDEMPQFRTKTANSTVMEVQNIIAAHAAAQGSAQILSLAPPCQAYNHPGTPMAPAPVALTPAAYLNLAASAPITAAPTVMLHQHCVAAAKCPAAKFRTKTVNSTTVMEVLNIITVHAAAPQVSTHILAPAPPHQAYSHTGAPIAPAPAVLTSVAYLNLAASALIAMAATVMLHQHGAAAAKCPQMDPPMMAVTSAIKNQFMSQPQIPYGCGHIRSQSQINHQ